jgi:transcriptional regulator with XRE-family HTH domain
MRVNKGGKQTIGERIQYLSQYWGITEDEFIKHTGIEKAEITKQKKDSTYVSDTLWRAVVSYDPNISRDWFLFNEGKMLIVDTNGEVDDYTDINQRVKDLRLKHNLNQSEMARILGCARSTYANIEHNNQTISFKHLRLLIKRFNVSYKFMIEGVIENNDVDQLKEKLAMTQAHLETVTTSNIALVSAIQQLVKTQ